MSSKRRIRKKACDGKIAHSTMHDADYSAAIQRKRGVDVYPYHCQFCRQYHVGHSPKAVYRARVNALRKKSVE